MIFITGGAGQGKYSYATKQFGGEKKIINHYHKRVEEQLKKGLNPMEEVKRFLEEEKPDIVISDELGCGLVPIEKEERNFRECSGRVSCYLAGQAQTVIRVLCGIGEKIK